MSDSVQRQAFISLPGISMVEGHWMHSPRPSYLDLTISIASFWQAWHSNVRFCEPGPSGSSRVSHIGAPHLAHVGCTMSSEGELT